MENAKKLKILFLCTGNSCRSQIAEGFTRQLKKGEIEARSAGIEPKGIDPRAIKTMAEVGIDISSQSSTSIDEIKDIEFDYVITLCNNAQKTCPSFPSKTSVLHVGFEDPPKLAENARDEEEAMHHYRRVRDQIKTFVEQLPGTLVNKKPDVEFDPRQLLGGISTVPNR
jgi:arsenate reductase